MSHSGTARNARFPAWFTHRTYHLLKLTMLNRRPRMVADRTLGLLVGREVD